MCNIFFDMQNTASKAPQNTISDGTELGNLKSLGNRICIIGLSSSGKSTFSCALARKLGIPVINLDTIAHYPHTAWQRRPNADFVADHDREIAADSWVMDGNYSVCMPQRFERATSVIWLDMSRFGCTVRYLLRCLKKDAGRKGKLEGATKEFNWALLKYTWFQYPKNKIKYQNLLENYSHPIIIIRSMTELNRYWTEWELPN